MKTEQTKFRVGGFTLIELVIVMAIIAILAAVAIPSYSRYAYRAHRVDGQNMLQHIATAQERYYSTFNRYTNDLTDFGYTAAAAVPSEEKYYKATVVLADAAQSYTATVDPSGAQSADKCGKLTVTNTGAKSYSGAETNGKCW